MAELKVITNGHERELLCAWELTPDEMREFDYLDWSRDVEGIWPANRFFRYKGEVYDLDEFTTTSGLDGLLDQWDGYHTDSYFSGIVVKIVDDPFIKVGRYYVDG